MTIAVFPGASGTITADSIPGIPSKAAFVGSAFPFASSSRSVGSPVTKQVIDEVLRSTSLYEMCPMPALPGIVLKVIPTLPVHAEAAREEVAEPHVASPISANVAAARCRRCIRPGYSSSARLPG